MLPRVPVALFIFLPRRPQRSAVRHTRIGIAPPREIGRARFGPQEIQQIVVSLLRLQLGNAAVFVFEIPEHNGLRWADLLAGGLECSLRHLDVTAVAGLDLLRDLRLLDALSAIGALLHYAAHPDGYVGVLSQL